MTDQDRELGTIVTRLTEIERRLAEGDKDMRELTRTVTELVKAMAGLTARGATTWKTSRFSQPSPPVARVRAIPTADSTVTPCLNCCSRCSRRPTSVA